MSLQPIPLCNQLFTLSFGMIHPILLLSPFFLHFLKVNKKYNQCVKIQSVQAHRSEIIHFGIFHPPTYKKSFHPKLLLILPLVCYWFARPTGTGQKKFGIFHLFLFWTKILTFDDKKSFRKVSLNNRYPKDTLWYILKKHRQRVIHILISRAVHEE